MRSRLLSVTSLLVLFSGIFLMIVEPVRADLYVCNRANYKAFVAFAFFNYGTRKWESEGWIDVYPGNCTTILTGDLSKHDAFVHLVDDYWNQWYIESAKSYQFCLKQTSFKIYDADKSCHGDMLTKNFQRVDSQLYDRVINLF